MIHSNIVSNGGIVRIRIQTEISPTSPSYYRAKIMESIEELEDQFREGEIDQHAYLIKKKALVKML